MVFGEKGGIGCGGSEMPHPLSSTTSCKVFPVWRFLEWLLCSEGALIMVTSNYQSWWVPVWVFVSELELLSPPWLLGQEVAVAAVVSVLNLWLSRQKDEHCRPPVLRCVVNTPTVGRWEPSGRWDFQFHFQGWSCYWVWTLSYPSGPRLCSNWSLQRWVTWIKAKFYSSGWFSHPELVADGWVSWDKQLRTWLCPAGVTGTGVGDPASLSWGLSLAM